MTWGQCQWPRVHSKQKVNQSWSQLVALAWSLGHIGDKSGLVGFMGNGDLWGFTINPNGDLWGFMGIYG